MLKLVRSGTPVQESPSDAPASKSMTMVEDTASHTLPHAQGEGLVMIIDDQVTGRFEQSVRFVKEGRWFFDEVEYVE